MNAPVTAIDSVVVYTDLDGTLLDATTYDWQPAAGLIACLSCHGIPLVPVTSKTFAEVLGLRAAIGLDGPFVVENGAAIFWPEGYFDNRVEDPRRYECRRFGASRETILSTLRHLRLLHRFRFTGFADLSAAAVARLTGLDDASAQLAMRRDCSEPLQWHDTESRLQAFRAELEASGLECVCGGRFLTVTSATDKGAAVRWLQGQFARRFRCVPLAIGIGDAPNDIPMLRACGRAVALGGLAPDDVSALQVAPGGPAAWADALGRIPELRALARCNGGRTDGEVRDG